ncbi:aldose epimerase family protein [Roseiterribacter gracilis]|uniref:Aldose 1-epimerase n=1 Tax=Roseiterribacter gracilis TaxID=2812848 RepID=A0A8S8XDG6_9PROT|nr:aldose 1-epimerase [Rhodospirillales bacterium TMPK1]
MTPIKSISLSNTHGMRVDILDLGGIVSGIHVPDRDGRIENVVLGFDDHAAYHGDHPYFGGLIGRCANRIAGARFNLDGRDYVLSANDGPHSLHGGADGFDKRTWRIEEADERSVLLSLVSADGDQGFPGNLGATVRYSVSSTHNELCIDFEATTDRPTLVNLTAHSYFNLAGSGDIRGHELSIAADSYTPVDGGLIPTGEIRNVSGTCFDLRRPRVLSEVLDAAALRQTRGYDQNFVLRGNGGPAARLVHRASGRVLDVKTTEPGLQLYTGNQLNGSVIGRGGVAYPRHAGLCLEPQRFPDAPHHPSFPSVRLDPGEVYHAATHYVFGIAD